MIHEVSIGSQKYFAADCSVLWSSNFPSFKLCRSEWYGVNLGVSASGPAACSVQLVVQSWLHLWLYLYIFYYIFSTCLLVLLFLQTSYVFLYFSCLCFFGQHYKHECLTEWSFYTIGRLNARWLSIGVSHWPLLFQNELEQTVLYLQGVLTGIVSNLALLLLDLPTFHTL